MSLVEDVVTSVVTALKEVETLNGLAFQVYSEKELLDKTSFIGTPSAGVVYEGLRARPENQDSGKLGLAAELNVAICIFLRPEPPNDTGPKSDGLSLLDLIRNKLRDTTSPAGSKWKFLVEAPALEKDGKVLWVQRWTTPVKLTQGL